MSFYTTLLACCMSDEKMNHVDLDKLSKPLSAKELCRHKYVALLFVHDIETDV